MIPDVLDFSDRAKAVVYDRDLVEEMNSFRAGVVLGRLVAESDEDIENLDEFFADYLLGRVIGSLNAS